MGTAASISTITSLIIKPLALISGWTQVSRKISDESECTTKWIGRGYEEASKRVAFALDPLTLFSKHNLEVAVDGLEASVNEVLEEHVAVGACTESVRNYNYGPKPGRDTEH